MDEYKLSVEDCEKLIGHCWDSGINALGIVGPAMFNRPESYEEIAKQCPHCGLRKVRKVETTYREERP